MHLGIAGINQLFIQMRQKGRLVIDCVRLERAQSRTSAWFRDGTKVGGDPTVRPAIPEVMPSSVLPACYSRHKKKGKTPINGTIGEDKEKQKYIKISTVSSKQTKDLINRKDSANKFDGKLSQYRI